MADHAVTEEWVPLPLELSQFEMTQMNDAQLLARGEIPVGAYDRLFLRPRSFDARDPGGTVLSIENVLEPTVVQFEIGEGDHVEIHLELIVLESLDGEERLSIFAKGARVESVTRRLPDSHL